MVVAIRPAVAVGGAVVVLRQPLLILALQFLFEDDAVDFGALFAEPFLLAQVSAIKLGVVRQLARPAHAGDEVLPALVVTIAAGGLPERVGAFSQSHGTFTPLKR